MVCRLLYFTKNATVVGETSRNWQVCLSASNKRCQRDLKGSNIWLKKYS